MLKVRVIPATADIRYDGAYLDEETPLEGFFFWPSQWKLHVPFPLPENSAGDVLIPVDHEPPVIIIEEGIARLFLIDTALVNETIELNIDSHFAFGDGRHPTTELCINLLGKMIAPIPIEKRNSYALVDVGTGSGILAILARKCGIGRVDALDIVEDAVRCAKANARLNKCHITIQRCDVGTFSPEIEYDIVAANIVTDVFLKNIASIARLIKPNGIMIASGISSGSAEIAGACFREHGLSIRETLFWKGWMGFVLEKGGATVERVSACG